MIESFSELYQRYSGDVFRFSLYLAGDRDLAHDLTSETFVRAWTAAGELRTATVKGYLLAIARNLYISELRRRARHVPLDAEKLDAVPASDNELLVNSELAHALRLLGQLSEPERTALLLRAQHEMPYEEIAAVLGISLASAKVKVHRTRLKLAQLRLKENR